MVVTIQAIMLRLLPRWLPTRRLFTSVPDTAGLTATGIQPDHVTHGVLAIGLDLHM